MKKILVLLVFTVSIYTSYAQQLVKLKISPINDVENLTQPNTPQLTTSFTKEIVTRIAGLNDWDGMNNYFNIYGSKLIIHQKEIAANGIINLILRKEDGGNFYGIYPLLRAEITPIHKYDTYYTLESE